MSVAGTPGDRRWSALGGPSILLAIVFAGLALLTSLEFVPALAVALGGVSLGGVARAARARTAHAIAPLAPLAALLLLLVTTVPTGVAALAGGLAGLAFLLWLADDPDRVSGGAARGLPRLLVPAVGFGIAWGSSFLLPGGVAPLGVGVALLVAMVVVAALLLRAPGVFDRDAAATS